jgi:hypothetical protein
MPTSQLRLGFRNASTNVTLTTARPAITPTPPTAPPPAQTPHLGGRGHMGIASALGSNQVYISSPSYTSPNTDQYSAPENIRAIEASNPEILSLPSTIRIPAIAQSASSTSLTSSPNSPPTPATEWDAVATYLYDSGSDLLAGQVCGRNGRPTGVTVMQGEDGFGIENEKFPNFAKMIQYFVANESVLTKKSGNRENTTYTPTNLANGDSVFEPNDPRVSIAKKDIYNDPNRYEIGISVPVDGITDSNTGQAAQFGMYIRFSRNPADGKIFNVKIGLGAANSRICAALMLGALTGQIDPTQNQQAAMAIAGYKQLLQKDNVSNPDIDRLLQVFTTNKSIELDSTDPLTQQHKKAVENLYKYACKTVFAEAFPKMVEMALEATSRAAESMKRGSRVGVVSDEEVKKLTAQADAARELSNQANANLAEMEAQLGIGNAALPSTSPSSGGQATKSTRSLASFLPASQKR